MLAKLQIKSPMALVIHCEILANAILMRANS